MLLYGKSRFSGSAVNRSETSVFFVLGVEAFVWICLIYTSIRFIYEGFLMGAATTAFVVAGRALFYSSGTKQVYLKKALRDSDTSGKGAGSGLDGEEKVKGEERRIFLLGEPGLEFYHTTLETEDGTLKEGSCAARDMTVFHREEDMTPTVKVTEESPGYLAKPAMPFRLYHEGGSFISRGITLELTSGHPDVFQVELALSGREATLDKKTYYIACMTLEGREEAFYFIPDFFDVFESLKSGGTFYEVKLYHPDELQKHLPVPVDFRLCREDKSFVCNGRVTYYFANRFMFEGKKQQP